MTDTKDLSIAERLRRLGYGHRPCPTGGKREIFRLPKGPEPDFIDNRPREVMGRFDAAEACAWVEQQEALAALATTKVRP
jgi:hypothetical protein